MFMLISLGNKKSEISEEKHFFNKNNLRKGVFHGSFPREKFPRGNFCKGNSLRGNLTRGGGGGGDFPDTIWLID